jgi:hypothetical protein
MSDRSLDDFLRDNQFPAAVSEERLALLTEKVWARIDQMPAAKAPGIVARIRLFLATPVPRYAIPMALALIFGSLFGASLPQPGKTETQAPLSTLISASAPTKPLGF